MNSYTNHQHHHHRRRQNFHEIHSTPGPSTMTAGREQRSKLRITLKNHDLYYNNSKKCIQRHRQVLLDNYKTMEDELKDYTCSKCGRSYSKKYNLFRHLTYECGVEPKFECVICKKKSRHKYDLQKHMRTHQQYQ